ncbi:patatin-like phospholipase family protein [Vibrio chagasii]|nr:patatin-like phospholipase family protein [Vibrio chagasii]
MEAYAVFEGGGVKGAALAGALAAADESNIKFVGYGGASAGSIVAFLASIGYQPKELLAILLFYRFSDFLEDGNGKKLSDTKEWFDKFSQSTFRKAKMIASPLFYYLTSSKTILNYRVLSKSLANNGLYKTTRLESILWLLLEAKHPSLNRELMKGTISFANLYDVTKVELKVITSDVHRGEAVVFDRVNPTTKDSCVIAAVCASSSYPLVFEPNSTLQENRLLVDGGLSCNLPSFIFNDKNHKKLPTYAFDLYKECDLEQSKYEKPNAIQFAWSLITTSLEASDGILSSIIDAIPVQVRVPNYINTLDFELKDISILEMYETGKASAKRSFESDPLTSKALAANGDPTKLARALYGSELYLNILEAILAVSSFEGVSVRSWLYSSVKNDDSEVVAICWRGLGSDIHFRNAYVFDKMSKSDVYTCWHKNNPVIQSGQKKNGKPYTRLCLPIFENHNLVRNETAINTSSKKMVGVLVLEMNDSADVCFWLDESTEKISREFNDVMINWLSILSKLMVSKEYAL